MQKQNCIESKNVLFFFMYLRHLCNVSPCTFINNCRTTCEKASDLKLVQNLGRRCSSWLDTILFSLVLRKKLNLAIFIHIYILHIHAQRTSMLKDI